MAGYHRKFCKNFSEVTVLLTELLKKGCKISLVRDLSKSFDKIKNLLCFEPILTAPAFSKPFQVAVNTRGTGAVLLQSDVDIEHRVCYFSK